MKSAGGEPCLYMHGWWKNVSLNGSQLSTALGTAKTSQGNKIWHYYYYYTAIINYPLSLTFTVSLSFWDRCTHHIDLHTHNLILPWSLRRIHRSTNTWRHVYGQKHKITNYMHWHTLQNSQFNTLAHWNSRPIVQSVHDDRRICALWISVSRPILCAANGKRWQTLIFFFFQSDTDDKTEIRR